MATPYKAEFSLAMEAEMNRLDELGEKYEIVEGEIVTIGSVKARHSWITRAIYDALAPYVREHGLGAVFTELNVQLAAEPKTIRIRDISFLSREQLASYPAEGYFQGPPTLAIEVVSADERALELNRKITGLLDAGAKAVWVAYDQQRQIHVYGGAPKCVILSAGDHLADEGILPGWRMPVADVFRSPSATPPA